MSYTELLFLSIGLAMDAFAVAVCKGLAIKKINFKKTCIIATYFGFFQALMPLLGYLIGSKFQSNIIKFDHWIAFVLLTCIGINMFKECLKKNDNNEDENMDFKSLFLLSIATSIDAFAVGITFVFFECNIIVAILNIGIITFLLSFLGVKIGSVVGHKYEKKALALGGIILIMIGLKILIEHLAMK